MAPLGRDQQRRSTAIVTEFEVGAALEQQANGGDPVGCGYVVGVAGRPHERGEAVGVAGVDRDPGVQEPADDRRVAARGGVNERCLAGRIDGGGARPVPQEELDEPLGAVERRGGQGRHAAPAGSVGRDPALEEEGDDVRAIGFDRQEQSGRPGEAAHRRIGAVVEQ